MLELGDGVELALAVDIRLDVIDLVLCRFETVLHLLQLLLDRLFVGLCIVPLEQGLIQCEVNLAD